MPPHSSSLRRRVHEVLEVARPSDATSRVVDLTLIALVAANILAVILESMEGLFRDYGELFDAFEVFSVGVFSLEYGLRVWAAAELDASSQTSSWRKRGRYVFSPLALADLAAILPFYLSALFAVDLRFLRVLRLLRIFKLTRYSGAMGMLLNVLRSERRAFGAALFVMLIVMTLASSGIYLAEHRAQPVAFGSIPAAMWWAMATLTTVGYGDVTPITALGRVFASVITIVGVGMVALPAGLLASGFSYAHRRNRLLLEREVNQALGDGVITGEEAESYDALAQQLGVAPEVAQEIVDSARGHGPSMADQGRCPHCGKSLE